MRKLRPKVRADEEQSQNKNQVCRPHALPILCTRIPFHLSKKLLRLQIHYKEKQIGSKSWVNSLRGLNLWSKTIKLCGIRVLVRSPVRNGWSHLQGHPCRKLIPIKIVPMLPPPDVCCAGPDFTRGQLICPVNEVVSSSWSCDEEPPLWLSNEKFLTLPLSS